MVRSPRRRRLPVHRIQAPASAGVWVRWRRAPCGRRLPGSDEVEAGVGISSPDGFLGAGRSIAPCEAGVVSAVLVSVSRGAEAAGEPIAD